MSPEGRGRFRLMLRLEEPFRYRLDATHPVFNRRLWSLQVQGSEAILVDYLQDLHCRYRDEAEIPAIPLGPFPFASLPRLLLGYLPLEPAGPVERRGGVLRFRDERQRAWAARPAKGAIEDWIVSGSDGISVHWFSSPEWLYLVSETEETELRWRETLREARTTAAPELRIPEASDEVESCDLGWIRGVADDPESDSV